MHTRGALRHKQGAFAHASRHKTKTHSCTNDFSYLLFSALCSFIIITLLMHNASMKEINTTSLHSRGCQGHSLLALSFCLFAFLSFSCGFIPLYFSYCVIVLLSLFLPLRFSLNPFSFTVTLPLSLLSSSFSFFLTVSPSHCFSSPLSLLSLFHQTVYRIKTSLYPKLCLTLRIIANLL